MKTNKKKLGLFVVHQIFLTREQRYKVADGESIEVVAHNLPTWILQGSTVTSEPSTEVFCKYMINNNGEDKQSINHENKKYTIWIPSCKDDHKLEAPEDEKWKSMTEDEKHTWFLEHPSKPCGRRLKDAKDGGNNGNLRFDQHKKVNTKNGDMMTIVHCIQFKPIESLEESIV
ncbi:MAG: hypothetical protein ACW99G_00470 [Candidatus Thorarchaeota archaeon]|jgi:hypothetical protein